MLFQILDTESQRSLTFPCWQSISLLPFQPRHFQCGSCRLPFGAMAEVKMTFLLHRTSPLPCCFDGSWIDPVRTGWVRLSRVLPKRMAEGHLLISGWIYCLLFKRPWILWMSPAPLNENHAQTGTDFRPQRLISAVWLGAKPVLLRRNTMERPHAWELFQNTYFRYKTKDNWWNDEKKYYPKFFSALNMTLRHHLVVLSLKACAKWRRCALWSAARNSFTARTAHVLNVPSVFRKSLIHEQEYHINLS